MDDYPPLDDPLQTACESFLEDLLDTRGTSYARRLPSGSVLAVAWDLYGPEALCQMLDEGVEIDQYQLLGVYGLDELALVEGLVWVSETGPRPFTLACMLQPEPLPVNLLRGSLHLATTLSHFEHLETLPHRPPPQMKPGRAADLSEMERRIADALTELPQGWRSLCCALALWRNLPPPARLDPERQRALAAAVCQLTGPWRLTPLVTVARWCEQWHVNEEQFERARAYICDHCGDESYRFLPQVPETSLLAEPQAEEGLLDLVHAFLDTLEPPEADDDLSWPEQLDWTPQADEQETPPTGRAGKQDGGDDPTGPEGSVISLFPDDN